MQAENERTEPFCDKFTVTTLPGNEKLLEENFEAFFHGFYAERSSGKTSDGQEQRCYRSASNGSLTWGSRGGVTWYTTSGAFLSDLRAAQCLNEYLCCFASHPDNPSMEHRVSLLDCTVDESVYAPPVLADILKKAFSGAYQFTRKAISPLAITQHMGLCAYNDSGDVTGSVYLGKSPMKVRAKVYDKRQERMQRGGGVVIPDTLRHELTVTGAMGITLHDVASPGSLFYHFYPKNLLSPRPYPSWAPSETGYFREVFKPMPSMMLKSRMQASNDLKAMFKLAALSGEHGFEYFMQVARKLYSEGSYSSTISA